MRFCITAYSLFCYHDDPLRERIGKGLVTGKLASCGLMKMQSKFQSRQIVMTVLILQTSTAGFGNQTRYRRVIEGSQILKLKGKLYCEMGEYD
jgi:hypothetical protein